MSEIKRNEILYEEGWRESAPVADEEVPVDEAPPKPEPGREPQKGGRPLLITVQLVLCLSAALLLFLLKTMDSGVYRDFMTFYREELQKPLVSREVFSSADLKSLFEDPVKVQATPDEAARR